MSGMTRVALVTGGSKGIGRAAALALAADGRTVAVGYGADDAGAKETVGMIEEAGGTAAAFGADVANEDEVRRLVDEIRDWREAPTVLVAAAGVSQDGLTVRYPAAEWDRTMAVNLRGTFLCARAVLPAMLRARWGRIVAVSSAVALRGNPGQAAYGASKAGLLGMTKSLAREYAGKGITANAVCPGFIETEMTAGLPQKARERLGEEIPVGRTGSPEETAGAIRFLASDQATYVTGAVLAVDGGLTA
jgi:3-oxoacyl-[acyl-carrier protein] reductase